MFELFRTFYFYLSIATQIFGYSTQHDNLDYFRSSEYAENHRYFPGFIKSFPNMNVLHTLNLIKQYSIDHKGKLKSVNFPKGN